MRGAGVYNLCSGRPVTIGALLDTLIAASGLEVQVERDPARVRTSEIPVLYGSYEKARLELGWEPRYSLEETLRDVYADCVKELKR